MTTPGTYTYHTVKGDRTLCGRPVAPNMHWHRFGTAPAKRDWLTPCARCASAKAAK